MNYRKIVQAWDETISKVAEQDLTKEDYDIIAEAVLKKNSIDDEIIAMLERRPRIFHLGMLPACRADVAGDRATEIAKAHSEAAAARLKLFEIELRGDWELIEQTKAAKAELAELLAWLELEHKRTQEAMGNALVTKRMQATHPVVIIDDWDKLPGQLSLLTKMWDHELKEGTRRAVIWLDFNTPHARDALKMPSMLAAAANCSRVVTRSNVAFSIWMPSYQ